VNSWERNAFTPSEENLVQIYELLEPNGLKMRVKAKRAIARNGVTVAKQEKPPVVASAPLPASITEMPTEDLKKAYADAVKRVAEIHNEIKARREKLLAMAKELETE